MIFILVYRILVFQVRSNTFIACSGSILFSSFSLKVFYKHVDQCRIVIFIDLFIFASFEGGHIDPMVTFGLFLTFKVFEFFRKIYFKNIPCKVINGLK